MSTFLQFCRDDSYYSPARSPARLTPKNAQKEERPALSNTKSQYLRNKMQAQNQQRLNPNNQEDQSGLYGYSRYERALPSPKLEEKSSLNLQKVKKQYQVYSQHENLSSYCPSKLNDFSFEEGVSRKTVQGLPEGTRENAKKRELEIKMSNIESLNDKIHSLLSLVKKEKRKEEEGKEFGIHQRPRNTPSHNKLVDAWTRPTENKLTPRPNQKTEPGHLSYKYEVGSKTPSRPTLQPQDSNIDRSPKNAAKAEPSSRLQKNTSQSPSQLQLQNVYVSPAKNRKRQRNQGSVWTYVLKDDNKAPEVEQKEIYSRPEVQRQQRGMKSIEQMLNQRRQARNKNKPDQTPPFAHVSSTYHQQSTQLPNKRQQLSCIRQQDNESQSSHSRKSSVYLDPQDRPARPEPSKDGFAGRIYKKSSPFPSRPYPFTDLPQF